MDVHSLLDISAPPPPETTSTEVIVGAAIVTAFGVAMLVWGRHLHRALAVLIGIAAGLAVGPLLGAKFNFDATLARIALAATLGLLGLVLARGIWALSLCAFAAAVTAAGVMVYHLQWLPAADVPAYQPPAEVTFAAWAQAMQDYLWNIGQALWTMRRGIIAASATGAGILALTLGLLKPRFTSIVITCLLGAVCVLTGATVLVLTGKPDLWGSVLQSAYYPLMAMGVLAVVGVVVQSVRARAEARKADEDQQAKAKKGKPDPGDPAEEQ